MSDYKIIFLSILTYLCLMFIGVKLAFNYWQKMWIEGHQETIVSYIEYLNKNKDIDIPKQLLEDNQFNKELIKEFK